jgi:uncharacterized repeat protein (TIGR01451 family)
MKQFRNAWLLLALVIPAGAVPAAAQEAQQPQALVITAENLMAGDAEHQEMAERGGDANALLPGDVVRYQLVFTNIISDSVRNVEFTDPIPEGLQYVGGTARSDRDDVVIEFSIDGGQTYAAQPMREVVENGLRVMRPAPPQTYTHIRWRVGDWIQPGAQVTAEFRARLPEPGNN